ncbi:hypothetical protein [Actinokineospora sp.]|uniref:hypothetical protein n=1 Tax=Actinokineospora sp. TaxID=1872133 RepID=UPI003D6B08D0
MRSRAPLLAGLLLILTFGLPVTASASSPPFVFPAGCCYLDGAVVRTVVPPAATPDAGRDNFYAIMGGVAGQKGVVAVGPGSSGYHGGDWKFFAVTWNVTPYLLTSESAVLAAAAVGAVTVSRVPENDFLCPIQR